MVKPWYMELGLELRHTQDRLSNKDLLKLRRFYTQQLALSRALLEAKQLGICKITTSGKNPLVSIHNEDIPLNGSLREML